KEEQLAQQREQEKANQKTSAATQASAAASSEPRLIYLICDQRDTGDVKALKDYLDQLGHEIMLPSFTGNEAELKQFHEDTLQSCDAVIIYYGNANDLWMKSMALQLNKIKALRTAPFLDKLLYICNPSSDEKAGYSNKLLT